MSESACHKRGRSLTIFTHPLPGPRPGIVPCRHERLHADDKRPQDSFRQAVGDLPVGREVSDDCRSVSAALRHICQSSDRQCSLCSGLEENIMVSRLSSEGSRLDHVNSPHCGRNRLCYSRTCSTVVPLSPLG